jgi:uncharacterized protein YbjT (DUF2867 family)
MRLLVVGATGALGRSVVDSALAAGHDVNALVRNPASASLPAGVQVIRGDVLDAASIEPAVPGCAAVICALGTPSPRKPTTLLERGTANLVAAMTRAGVPRLVCVTLLGVGKSRPNTALLYRQVILRVLAPMVPDKENQEEVVRNSGLDWVLVRPPTIVGLRSGPARVIREGERSRIGLVSHTSLAELLVHAAGTDEYTQLAIAVGR